MSNQSKNKKHSKTNSKLNNNQKKPKSSTSNKKKSSNHKGQHQKVQNNDNQHVHQSILTVPQSKTKRNRKRGLVTKEIKKSFEDDSNYKRGKGKMKDLNDGPYNELQSFYSLSTSDEIFNAINMILKTQKNCDVYIHDNDYSIRGRQFINNIMCEWQIELFKLNKSNKIYPNHILVEFQRRNGDHRVFQIFLCEIIKDLKQSKLINIKLSNSTGIIQIIDNHLCKESKLLLCPNDLMNNDDNNDNDNNNGLEEKQINNKHHKQMKSDKLFQIDDNSLTILIDSLFSAQNRDLCRTASTYLANHMENNRFLVNRVVKLEPHILSKFSDLLLKSIDPQIVLCVGCCLLFMLQQSNKIKNEAIKLNIKTVCKKVSKRWTQPVESRFGSSNRHVIKVIPSIQVAERMQSCIAVLE